MVAGIDTTPQEDVKQKHKERNMAQAKDGDRVKVHYTGTFADGTVFDSSFDEDPFEFVIGEQSVLPGFENAIIGMNEGETKVVTVLPEEGYGKYDRNLIVDIERSHMPEDIDLQIGKILEFHADDGAVALVTIRDITETKVTLDGNHPLAGKELTFEIKLLEIL